MEIVKKRMSLVPKYNFLHDRSTSPEDRGLEIIEEEMNLMNTIKIPKKLNQLSDRLPKSNYEGPASP